MTVTSPRIIVGLPVQRREAGGIMSVAPAYTETLIHLGALPLVIPLSDPGETALAVAPLLALCDGFLLTGSVADVHPRRYRAGGVPEGGYCDERRDALDWAILDHADRTDKPVFGICRGCQVMNVYRGGTLAWRYRDILPDSPIEHQRSDIAAEVAHAVSWSKDTWLASQMPMSEHRVNSLHRQVCDQIAPTLQASALSEDGLIEAIEDTLCPNRFFAVQWHPEILFAAGDGASQILFDRFLRACHTKIVNPLAAALSDSPCLISAL